MKKEIPRLLLWALLNVGAGTFTPSIRPSQTERNRRHGVTVITKYQWKRTRTRQLSSSLFDPDDENDDNDNIILPESTRRQQQQPESDSSRKFTGASSRNKSRNSNNRQDEYNLVELATSPRAFLIQAVGILMLTIFVVYVGATGQLGIGNYFDDDDDDGIVWNDSISSDAIIERVQPPIIANDKQEEESPTSNSRIVLPPPRQTIDSPVWI